MSYESEHNELRSRFNDQWGDTTPVAWPDVTFNPENLTVPWVRFSIQDGNSKQLTIGADNNPHRCFGQVSIQIFIPLGQGDATALQLADAAAGIFRNWRGTNIVCRQPLSGAGGPDGQGWYMLPVTIPFHRDELF